MSKKIGIITSGGDAPGMNACVKSVVETAYNYGFEAVAFYRSFSGIINNDYATLLPHDVKHIFNNGGSIIFSTRSPEFMEEKNQKIAAANLKKLNIDCLVVIGGNGSIKGAKSLSDLGINVLTIPATIDNDINSTDISIGFDTAVNNAVNVIDNIKQTMNSNERISIIECMGRYGGNIALYSAMASEADIVALPEDPLDKEHIFRFISEQINYGNQSPVVVVSEKQYNVFELAKEVEREFQHECRAVIIGYLQRGGSPTVADRLLGLRMGVSAVQMVEVNQYNLELGTKADKIIACPIGTNTKKSNFRQDLYDSFKILHNTKIKRPL